MNTKRFLAPVGAAIALAAGTAAAQHDHMSMHAESQRRAAAAAPSEIAEGTVKDGVRTVVMAVTENGFEPSRVKAKKGERVRLVVTRRTDSTCAKEIVIREHGINKPLPLGQAVTVEFTPAKSGEIRYACGMDHVAGVVFIP